MSPTTAARGTRYAKVLDASGRPVSVREALALINQILDEVLAEQEGDFGADSRWALAWLEQHGFAEGEYGVAGTLSKAKNTSVAGMVEAGILTSKGGTVRLPTPRELRDDWDPATDARLTTWEAVHHLIGAPEAGGESGAAGIAQAAPGHNGDGARGLCYRLYTLCGVDPAMRNFAQAGQLQLRCRLLMGAGTASEAEPRSDHLARPDPAPCGCGAAWIR